jgi:hypothetical protein
VKSEIKGGFNTSQELCKLIIYLQGNDNLFLQVNYIPFQLAAFSIGMQISVLAPALSKKSGCLRRVGLIQIGFSM